MAFMKSNALFFITSPRTPFKMIPEIRLLHEQFEGRPWNTVTQTEFYDCLVRSDFYEGSGSSRNQALSARDRINRGPKALGFVNLKPVVTLTEAGRTFVYGKRPEEIFLRQLLKFQLPSPYHMEREQYTGTFCVRPYLEIFRLIRDLEYITFDEFKIFAINLTDYHYYDIIRDNILKFREDMEREKGKYKILVRASWDATISTIFSDEIAMGRTKTRETQDNSIKKFFATKRSNFRDYTDACFRYLRYTGLVSISNRSASISIFPEKLAEVDFFLQNEDQQPVFQYDEAAYQDYLFNPSVPTLYADNRGNLSESLLKTGNFTRRELERLSVEELKNLRDEMARRRKDAVINAQTEDLKTYALYSEVIDTYNEMLSDGYYDAPLMFEYNTWRAMTMLDGGTIRGNFKFDDYGQPLSTAAGNRPDIECDYEEFALSVEVTLQAGQRQFESEGESVPRHYGQLKKRVEKDTYCLFIAPTINASTLAHFYGLNHFPIALYGGKAKIIPLELDQFMRLIENSYNYPSRPGPSDIRHFLDSALLEGDRATDENDWKERIQTCVNRWLCTPC